MRTVHVYGMLVRDMGRGPRSKKQYQNPNTVGGQEIPTLTYHVRDNVSSDDILALMRFKGVRVAPTDGKGHTIKTIVGIDDDVEYQKGMKLLDRPGLSRALDKDLKEIEWVGEKVRK